MADQGLPSASEAPISQQEADEISLIDIALVLAENLRILILVPVVAGLAALGISFLIPPTYTATSRILPPGQQQSTSAVLAAQLGSLAGLVGSAAGIKNPADQYVALLKSRSIYDAIIQRFNLRELYNERYIEDTRKELEKRTKVSAGVKDGIISIDVDDHDPKRAADMANAFVEELRNLTNTLAITEAAQRRLFFEAQLKQTKDNLTKSELALRGSGIGEAALKTMPQSAVEALARLKAQITAQEIKLASMRMFMTDSNPQFRLAIQELVALRTELSKAEQSDTAKAAGNGAEYIAKYRDFKYHETLFELMAKQFELARLDEAREGAVIQVVDAAQPPERKSKPKRALITAITALAVFFVMMVFVLVRRTFQNMAGERESAEKLGRLHRLLGLPRT
ncbi:MAG TPA: Wzz/FepE/Etk N-terminal domain-containing protein [Burkholderiales bacterium]|nr:Wzz/FepE/Etk N-terminal domain-containing protein [Burkholderiales bacterium]